MSASGVLDIERRVELACLELLQTYTDLTDLCSGGTVLARRDASAVAVYPCAYVEYINAVEFGLHTGCYFGTLRLGAVSYADDDIDREDVKKITGALRSWLQQEDLLTQLNATTAGKTLGQHVQFYAVQLDSGASYIPFETGIAQRLNEIVIDAMAVARPSYP